MFFVGSVKCILCFILQNINFSFGRRAAGAARRAFLAFGLSFLLSFLPSFLPSFLLFVRYVCLSFFCLFRYCCCSCFTYSFWLFGVVFLSVVISFFIYCSLCYGFRHSLCMFFLYSLFVLSCFWYFLLCCLHLYYVRCFYLVIVLFCQWLSFYFYMVSSVVRIPRM